MYVFQLPWVNSGMYICCKVDFVKYLYSVKYFHFMLLNTGAPPMFYRDILCYETTLPSSISVPNVCESTLMLEILRCPFTLQLGFLLIKDSTERFPLSG